MEYFNDTSLSPNYAVCASTSTLVYLLHAAGDLLHFIFCDRYVEWAAARGGVGRGGGQCTFFKFCLYSKWFHFLRHIFYKDRVI